MRNSSASSRSKREEPVHRFDDPEYIAQLREFEDSISNSVEQGLKSQKGEKRVSSPHPKTKRRMLWSDLEDLESSSSEHEGQQDNSEEIQFEEKSSEKEEIISQIEIEKKDKLELELSSSIHEQKSPSVELIDLNKYKNVEELESLMGLEKIKEQLQQRGLKSGGSLRDRATRLYSIKGKKESEIDPKLLARENSNDKKRKGMNKLNK